MTTGDRSRPKAPSARGSAARTPAVGEPTVTGSRSSDAAPTVVNGHGADVSAGDDDVLDRLARLGTVAPPEPAADALVLPAIVEADPTYPPLPAASTSVLATTLLDDRSTSAGAAGLADVVAGPAMAVPVAVAPAPEAVPAVAPAPATNRQPPRPVTFKRRKPRVRRVTRVVRHVDTWSVFKVALVFNAVLYLVCLTAGVLLWNVADSTGTVDNVEKFFEQFGWETFEFKAGEIYHNAWVGGLFVAVGLTGFAVLVATIFNLITDLVGGIRVSVLEEEVVARAPARATDRTEPSTGAG